MSQKGLYGFGGDMPAGEFSLGETIDENEALHAPEVSVCAGY